MRQLCPPFLCVCLYVVDELWPATINTEASVGRGSAADWSPAILSTRNLNGKLIKQLVGWWRSMIKWRPMSQHVKKNADNVKRKGTWVFLYYGQDIAFACCVYIPGRICNDCVCCVHVLYRIVYTRLLQQQYLLSVGLFFFVRVVSVIIFGLQ